jgi:hypothetical protein
MAVQKQQQQKHATGRAMRQPNQTAIKRAASNLSKRRISSTGADPGAVADLWTLHHERLILEYERARESRVLLSGEWSVPLPPEYSDEDRAAYGGTASDWWMVPLKTAQALGDKRCELMRPEKPGGLSKAAQRVSTSIEVFINGLMEALFPFAEWIENLFNEGCAAIKVIPAPAHYENCPSLYSDDDHLTEDEYGQVDERTRDQYERFEDDAEDAPGLKQVRYKRVAERYRVNSEGESDDGSDGWAFDRTESTAFFEDERDQYLGDHTPIVMELLSRLDFAPINPRFVGKGVAIDGVVIRRLFARDELRSRGYWWDEDGDAMEQVGAEGMGKDGDVYLYETYLKDGRNGHIFVAYQVAGCYTTKGPTGKSGRENEIAIIDLTAKYGMTRVPVVFRYGTHFGTSDPSRRSVPFILPYASDMKRRDILATATTISAMWDAMPAYGQRITPDNTPAAALNGDVDLNITVRPNSIVPIYGDLERIGGQGVGKDVPMLMGYFDSSFKGQAPDPGALGGPGPTSGVDRVQQGTDMEKAHSHVLEGGRSGYEEAASLALEICTNLGKMPGKPPVSINVLSKIPAAQPGSKPTQQRLTLSPNAAGTNWTLVAHYPSQPGENLAAAAQWQSFATGEDPLITREEFRTWAVGDPSPEIFEAKRMLQRWMDTDAGMQYVMEQVTEALADDRLKSILELQNEGRMTPGQVPTAAMADVMPAPQVAPQLGRPDVSALAGAVGGAVQASVPQGGAPTTGVAA